ncbi:hypothetical protein M378DRAFT_157479, partial [Amanita muscaria Koide BX008]
SYCNPRITSVANKVAPTSKFTFTAKDDLGNRNRLQSRRSRGSRITLDIQKGTRGLPKRVD